MDAVEYEKGRRRMCRTNILKKGSCEGCDAYSVLIYTIKCLALIFVAAPGAMLIGALLIYLFALCCKQISRLLREQK